MPGKLKYHRIKAVVTLISLHWLRVPERIVFKVAVQTYRALHAESSLMPLTQYLRQFTIHQSPTSRPDKNSGLPPRTICVFLLSDCLLLDVMLSLSLALVFGTPFLLMSLAAPSLLTFRKRLKLHLFPLSCPGLVF